MTRVRRGTSAFWAFIFALALCASNAAPSSAQDTPSTNNNNAPAAAPEAGATDNLDTAGTLDTSGRPGVDKPTPTTPPAGAMHDGGTPAKLPPRTPEQPGVELLNLKVMVNVVGDDWKKTPTAGIDVLLEASVGASVVRTYTEKTGSDGRAVFGNRFRVKGARYVPVVVHDGVRYQGEAIPAGVTSIERVIDVYKKTYEDKNLLVSDMMTTVDITEGYLVFMQMWTLVNTSPATFDVANALDPKYAEGLVIELPLEAEGVNASIVRGAGDVAEAKVVENKVFVKEPILPAGEDSNPVRVQLRYSIKLLDPTVEYSQPIDYKVEGMRVIVATTTNYKKHPKLDLELTAPGFPEVGKNQQMPGMREGLEFVVARNGSANPGDTLDFTIDGYPVANPMGRWVVLAAGGFIFFFGVLLFRRERGKLGNADKMRKLKLQALEEEREDLYDALRELDDRHYNGEISDRLFDLEVAVARERLALVLRRLNAEPKA